MNIYFLFDILKQRIFTDNHGLIGQIVKLFGIFFASKRLLL